MEEQRHSAEAAAFAALEAEHHKREVEVASREAALDARTQALMRELLLHCAAGLTSSSTVREADICRLARTAGAAPLGPLLLLLGDC